VHSEQKTEPLKYINRNDNQFGAPVIVSIALTQRNPIKYKWTLHIVFLPYQVGIYTQSNDI